MSNKTKSGFVAIIGPTNAGKSTFLNTIMGRKVSIVSHKVQTTRTQLRAVKMIGDSQIIFVDTPGVFRPARKLDRAMIKAATDSISDADAVLVMIDGKHGITESIREIAKLIKKAKEKSAIFAVINKVDAIKKETLLPLAQELNNMDIFKEIFMISALKNKGIEPMLRILADQMPESPYLFEPKDLVDVPDEIWLAEITREKIYKFIHKELPYYIHVSTDSIETDEEGVFEINQTIYVKTDGHKKIIIGKNGQQLKQIGTLARHEIQDEWEIKARLNLFVRVEDWENKPEHYMKQGLNYVK